MLLLHSAGELLHQALGLMRTLSSGGRQMVAALHHHPNEQLADAAALMLRGSKDQAYVTSGEDAFAKEVLLVVADLAEQSHFLASSECWYTAVILQRLTGGKYRPELLRKTLEGVRTSRPVLLGAKQSCMQMSHPKNAA